MRARRDIRALLVCVYRGVEQSETPLETRSPSVLGLFEPPTFRLHSKLVFECSKNVVFDKSRTL